MKRANLPAMSVAELVDRFAAIGIEQDKAIFEDDNAKFTRLYWQMDAVRNELKSRPGDQRSALLPLYAHPNFQVCLTAALSTMEFAPEAARQVFQKIADSRRYPQAADALAALWRLDGRPLVGK
jgi:cytochrome c oxidase assembly protein Cox11